MKRIAKMTNDYANWGSEKARMMCEEAIAIDPGCYPAYVYLGVYEQDKKQYERMEWCFLKALDLADNPDNEWTWDWVVMTLDDGLKDYERLVRYLQRFYEKAPKLTVARYLARTLAVELNRKSEAISILDQALKDHTIEDYSELRLTAVLLGKDFDERNRALSVINEYLLKHPDDKRARKLRKKVERGKWPMF